MAFVTREGCECSCRDCLCKPAVKKGGTAIWSPFSVYSEKGVFFWTEKGIDLSDGKER